MIEFVERYFTHEDYRGTIDGLINTGTWGEINIIFSKMNTIRGNHYHENTTELFIVLDGRIEVITQKVKNNKNIGVEERVFVIAGDVFVIEPNTNHIFNIVKNSKWINVLSKPLSATEPDIFNVSD